MRAIYGNRIPTALASCGLKIANRSSWLDVRNSSGLHFEFCTSLSIDLMSAGTYWSDNTLKAAVRMGVAMLNGTVLLKSRPNVAFIVLSQNSLKEYANSRSGALLTLFFLRYLFGPGP